MMFFLFQLGQIDAAFSAYTPLCIRLTVRAIDRKDFISQFELQFLHVEYSETSCRTRFPDSRSTVFSPHAKCALGGSETGTGTASTIQTSGRP